MTTVGGGLSTMLEVWRSRQPGSKLVNLLLKQQMNFQIFAIVMPAPAVPSLASSKAHLGKQSCAL
jgi:uncharacterized Tic20 family protein